MLERLGGTSQGREVGENEKKKMLGRLAAARGARWGLEMRNAARK